ncbi:MAG: malate dehydrogenase [Candidatus Marinimicrobia bacterium]|nr:malate dehydrogenase [Candidatus Neomarinimicrobiota bacterium]
MEKVSIIGSGNVGVAAAFYLAEKGIANIMLVDILEGKAEGSALDLAEASPLRGYDIKIRGSSHIEDIKDSRVVVITAGKVRKPNTLRLELLEDNVKVIDPIIEDVKKYAPKSIVIVITEPVTTLTYYTFKKTGFDRTKVIGVAGKLDVTRVCEYTAQELGVTPVEVSALVLGGHHKFMVIPPEFIRVCGIPITELLPKEKVDKIISEAREAGTTILSMLKRQTSMYSPGASIAETVGAIINDTRAILCVPTCLDGEYGFKNICLGVPVQLGKNGVEKIIELELSLPIREELQVSADVINKTIESMGI